MSQRSPGAPLMAFPSDPKTLDHERASASAATDVTDMGRITIIAHDQGRERMAAPSIRCVEMARGLVARGHTVTLAVPNDPEMALHPIQQIRDDGPELTVALK